MGLRQSRRNPDYVVLTDSNEQKPIVFPTAIKWQPSVSHNPRILLIDTETAPLYKHGHGDYTLKGWQGKIGIERKGGFDEIVNNLFTFDQHRSGRAMYLFVQNVKHRILFLDFSIDELFGHLPYKPHSNHLAETSPHVLLDGLAAFVMQYQMHVVGPLPTTSKARTKQHQADRRRSAEWLLRLMIGFTQPQPAPKDVKSFGKILKRT